MVLDPGAVELVACEPLRRRPPGTPDTEPQSTEDSNDRFGRVPVRTAHDIHEPHDTRALGLVRGVVADRVVVSTILDPFLPLRALAAYAGLSVRKLRDLLDDPVQPLPAYQVGGKILVRRSEFDGWMTAHRRQHETDVERIVSDVLRTL